MKKGYIYTASLALMLALGFSKNGLSQNIGINTSGATPDASAGLDISFTDKGLLIPRVNITNLNLASPITSPAISLLVYNTNTTTGLGYYYWDGSRWVNLNTNAWKVTGNAGTTPATNFLGTTDNQALALRTNNTERMRLLTNGKVVVNATAHASNDQLVAYGTVNWGVAGYNTGTGGGSVYGENSIASNGYATIEGSTLTTASGVGVKGLSLANSGTGYGVYGSTNSPAGIGVYASQVITTGSGWGLLVGGWAGGSYSWQNLSDQRLKRDVKTIDHAIDKLKQVRGVTYYFKDDAEYKGLHLDSKNLQFGFIAQEIEEIFPTMVREANFYGTDVENTSKEVINNEVYHLKSVSYTTLIPVAIEAIKEQQQIIESQNAKIERLEKAIEELKELIKK